MPSVMQRVATPNTRHNKDVKYRAKLKNVDPELTKYNDVIREKSLEEIYAEKLQPAFEAFNERQKRKDRRLDVKWGCSTYLEYQRKMDEKARASKNAIDRKGRPPVRELVWQFGNPSQGYGSADQTPESRERIKKMLLECQEEAERRYPQLLWGDLAFHADEVSQDADDEEHGSLHLHSDFVPICVQNKQGPDVQVAFERCLKEMGFDTFQEWKHDLDDIMETVLHRYGLERTYMDNHEKHQSSKEFHRQQAIRRQTKDLEAQRSEAQRSVQFYGVMETSAEESAKRAHERAVEEKRRADAEAARADRERQRAKAAKEEARKMYEATAELSALKTEAQYQRQVIDNDKALDNLASAINASLEVASRNNMPLAAAQAMMRTFINGISRFIESLKINISKVNVFEVIHRKPHRHGLRQSRTLAEILKDAYVDSEATMPGADGRRGGRAELEK